MGASRSLYSILLSCGVIILSIPGHQTCPAKCTCRGTTVVCLEPSMTSFPSALPEKTETLEIKGTYSQRSQFHHLSGSDLSAVTSLKVLVVTHTLLDSIDEDAFKGLTNLTSLDLSLNRLTSLPSGVFNGLSSLSMLHLSGNEHLNFPPDIFKGPHNLIELYLSDMALIDLDLDLLKSLNNLLYLDLSHNGLKFLPSGMADGHFLTNLQTLDLSFNQLTFLGQDMGPLLQRVATVLLSDNPWQCHCELKWLLEGNVWSHIVPSHASSSRIPVCDGPDDVANMALTLLKPDQLVCTPAEIVDCLEVQPQLEGSTFKIQCNMTGQPFPFVSWKTVDGLTKTGSSRQQVAPELDLQPPKVTISLVASKATNGTLTIMAQNKYGSGTKKIEVFVKPVTTTTTVSVPTTKNIPGLTTPKTPAEDKEQVKDKEAITEGKKDEGGGSSMMMIGAGAGGAALLLLAIVVYVLCRKANKNKVKALEPEKQNSKEKINNNNNNDHSNGTHNTDGDNGYGCHDNPNDYGVEKIDYGRVNLNGVEGGSGGYRPPPPYQPMSAWDV